MSWEQWVVLAPGLVALVLGVLAFFKYKPGQREQVNVDVAQGNINVAQASLNIAKGSVELVSETYEKEFRRLNKQLEEMRQYQTDTDSRLAELGALLRAEKAEKELVKRENAQLKARVQQLEDEVARLKAAQQG